MVSSPFLGWRRSATALLKSLNLFQPLRLDIKRRLTARSDRVKSCDLHPTEQWMLVSLYNGNVHIWNYESQQLVKSFEVCDLPVRAAQFVPRKNWVVTGSDDMQVGGHWHYLRPPANLKHVLDTSGASVQLQHAGEAPLVRRALRLCSVHRGPPNAALHTNQQR